MATSPKFSWTRLSTISPQKPDFISVLYIYIYHDSCMTPLLLVSAGCVKTKVPRSDVHHHSPYSTFFWGVNLQVLDTPFSDTTHINPDPWYSAQLPFSSCFEPKKHLGLLNPHVAVWNPYLVYINIHQWQPWPSYSHLSPHRALYSSRPVGSQQPRWSQNSMVLHQKSEEIY